MKKLFLACLLAVGAVAAQAEVFYDIQYGDTLGIIKQKYPGAIYEKQSAAWVKSDEAFFKMSGVGMQHELRIAFFDWRTAFKNILNNSSSKDSEFINRLSHVANKSDDDALTVMWVRVVYARPIPIEAFKKKYGKMTCKMDDDFQEVCEFPDKAMQAALMPDGKFVQFADTEFTKQEKINAFRRRGQPVPDWLLKP